MAAGRRVEQIAMSEMPRPGDTITGFFVQQGRCFRMVYSDQLQATHCYQPPAWKGVWRGAKGRSHYVEACREHAPKGNAAMVETPGVGQGESVSPGSPPVLRTGRATVLDGFDVAQ